MYEVVYWMLKAVSLTGIAGVAVYGWFRFFGERWIENRFAQALQDARHQHERELAALKQKIDLQLSRRTTFHQKELEVLTAVWGYLVELNNRVAAFVTLYIEFPDFDRMSAEELEEYLATSKLQESEKTRMRRAQDKKAEYHKCRFWQQRTELLDALYLFRDTFDKGKIFVADDLKGLFVAIRDAVIEAFVSQDMGFQGRDGESMRKAYATWNEKVSPLMLEIEAVVQKRLRTAAD